MSAAATASRPSVLAPRLARARARRAGAGAASTTRASAAVADVASTLTGDDLAAWESSKALVMDLVGVDDEWAEKTLIRAFGWGAQSYWRNEKTEEIPDADAVEARIAYLVEIGIAEDKVAEILTKVPEVLGCDVAERLEPNVAHIEKNYFMKRGTKNFANYILRVPQVLGNNLDCVGDCAGECNRCWARC
jgi:hypothetical protein